MATSFNTVIDMALVDINDYKFTKAFIQGEEIFNKWCDGFLLRSVPYFTDCRQNLSYNTEAREFDADLSNTEISILADLFKIAWYERERNDSTGINDKLQASSGGFKTHSPSQNLKEKTITLDGLREKLSQRLSDYQLEDLDSINI